MNYAKWEKSRSTCSCGWSGLNSEIQDVELFRELFEYFCPRCFAKLGIQSYDLYVPRKRKPTKATTKRKPTKATTKRKPTKATTKRKPTKATTKRKPTKAK